jgi:hypothetical protein
MSETAIRAQIKTNLEAVTGIGVVHNYERYSRSFAQFLSLMTSSGTVNGWMIHREANSNTRQVGGRIERYHTYRIFGIYEMDDASASEVTLQALLELIYAAFIDDPRLSGTAAGTEPIQIESIDADEFGGRLYHTAELILEVMERIT